MHIMNQLINNKFVSVFKIDGVPILPPLITPNKRKLIQRYKEQAILIENKLLSKRKYTAEIPLPEKCGSDCELNFEDDFLKISNFLQSKAKLNNTNRNASLIQDLQKSDTLIYDVISNTVIIPYESENTESFSNLNKNFQQNLNFNKNLNAGVELTKSTDILNDEFNKKLPCVIVKPPTPDNDSELFLSLIKSTEIIETEKSITESYILSEEDKSANTNPLLIRTNSFILEKASNALVEHMDKLAVKEQERLSLTQNIANQKKSISSFPVSKSPKIIGYKKKGNQNIYDQTEIKKENIFTNTRLFKNKRSPYEIEIPKKTKISKKHKTPILKTSSNITLKTKSFNSSNHKNRINENENVYYTNAVDDIEKQHKLQLMELTKKHQEEQNKMKESFEYKQKMLLEHLESPIESSTLDNPNYPIDQTERLNSEKIQCSKKFFTNNITSSRFYNNKSENKNVLKETANNNMADSLDRRELAATIINKYARGYLIRRIFKTYYVQKIVMIIRDTLLFAIHLHNHTKCNDNDENIRLKVGLLQQLKSSCYNLHNVFFKLTKKQQMILISQDRIFKTKK